MLQTLMLATWRPSGIPSAFITPSSPPPPGGRGVGLFLREAGGEKLLLQCPCMGADSVAGGATVVVTVRGMGDAEPATAEKLKLTLRIGGTSLASIMENPFKNYKKAVGWYRPSSLCNGKPAALMLASSSGAFPVAPDWETAGAQAYAGLVLEVLDSYPFKPSVKPNPASSSH